jgi:hypothetical protein
MTAREMASELKKRGHKVKFTVRKDGSIRITEIDGMKYPASQGNVHARQILGVQLSGRRQAQLDRIALPKGRKRKKKSKAEPSEEEKDLRKRTKRVQRIWRKNRQEGTISWKNVEWTLHHFGYREAKERLEQSERHAKGLAYPANLQAYCDRLMDAIHKSSGRERHLIYDIWKFVSQRINADIITEYQLQLLIEKWYDYTDFPPKIDVVKWHDISHTILLASNAGRAHKEYNRKKHSINR